MKSRSTHILGCHFPLPLPALLRGKLELESQVTDSILLEQESNASRVSLLPYSACTGVGVVGGAKKCQAGQHQPAGEEEEAGPDLVSDRSQALAGLARAGARSNRRPCAPQRYTFLQCCAREILCYGAALFTFLPAV